MSRNFEKYVSGFFEKGLSRSGDAAYDNNHKLQGGVMDFRAMKCALSRFIEEPSHENSFDVFYCYCEIFGLFGEGYENIADTVLKILCDFEFKAGALSDKHRDHYVHSVTVFAIGLAVYEKNSAYRKAYELYCDKKGEDARRDFLLKWGLASLFHDVGYPFELAFGQIKSYIGQVAAEDGAYPVVRYANMDEFMTPEGEGLDTFALYCPERTLTEELALRLDRAFGRSDSLDIIREEIIPDLCFADHALFGAFLLAKKLLPNVKDGNAFEAVMAALTAILAHNAFIRKAAAKPDFKKLRLKDPVTYLMVFADTVQDYGRACYGRYNCPSKYAFDCNIVLSGKNFDAEYLYIEGDENFLKNAAADLNAFKKYVDVTKIFNNVKVSAVIAPLPKKVPRPDGFYKDILKIAYAVHAHYLDADYTGRVVDSWNSLSLEYKMSNIRQAKSYFDKINSLGYYFTDAILPVKEVSAFTDKQIARLAEREHKSWLKEKKEMGWRFGERNDETGMHPSVRPYKELSAAEKQKDIDAVTIIPAVLKKCGYRIYRKK